MCPWFVFWTLKKTLGGSAVYWVNGKDPGIMVVVPGAGVRCAGLTETGAEFEDRITV